MRHGRAVRVGLAACSNSRCRRWSSPLACPNSWSHAANTASHNRGYSSLQLDCAVSASGWSLLRCLRSVIILTVALADLALLRVPFPSLGSSFQPRGPLFGFRKFTPTPFKAVVRFPGQSVPSVMLGTVQGSRRPPGPGTIGGGKYARRRSFRPDRPPVRKTPFALRSAWKGQPFRRR